MSGWDTTAFEKVGSRLGKVVEVAKETVEKRQLEFGRWLLQVEDLHNINTVVHVECFGYSFPVTIRED